MQDSTQENTSLLEKILLTLRLGCKNVFLTVVHVLSVPSGSCLAAVERAVAETDIGAVLPLGRQHSLLNIINVVIHKLGHLIHIYLPKVLQILLCVTASVSTILDNRDQVIRVEVDKGICLIDF